MACALCLTEAAVASATIRYAAPGGTAADTVCVSPQAVPCSINDAAAGPDVTSGDEAIVAPGNYSDTAGDLGGLGFVQITAGVDVHGTSGQSRPVITLNDGSNTDGAFFIGDTAIRLSHVEIDTSAARANFFLIAGTVDDVIARSSSTVASTIVCTQTGGIIRDSACLSSGSGAVSVGASDLGGGPFSPILRNVTAIATGSGGIGISYRYFTSTSGTTSAKSVIAEGSTTDVEAGAIGAGASSTINLDHSDYDTTNAASSGGGTASVTAAGSGTNLITAPILASDGFHQLTGSPTIDTGAVDGSSGAADIDGQARTIGITADIGADELGHPTSTALSCVPSSVVAASGTSTCTATVADTASGPTSPTGSVRFSSTGSGSFSGGGSCTLAALNATQSSCQVIYRPTQVGSGTHQVSGSYSADSTHDPSQGTVALSVNSASSLGTGPNARIGKKPKKKTTSRKAKFTFFSNEAGSHFKCKLDHKPFKACRSPFKKKVEPGKHRFQVEAIDAAGDVDPTPASYRWKVLAG